MPQDDNNSNTSSPNPSKGNSQERSTFGVVRDIFRAVYELGSHAASNAPENMPSRAVVSENAGSVVIGALNWTKSVVGGTVGTLFSAVSSTFSGRTGRGLQWDQTVDGGKKGGDGDETVDGQGVGGGKKKGMAMAMAMTGRPFRLVHPHLLVDERHPLGTHIHERCMRGKREVGLDSSRTAQINVNTHNLGRLH